MDVLSEKFIQNGVSLFCCIGNLTPRQSILLPFWAWSYEEK
jgi:hypothetical protein